MHVRMENSMASEESFRFFTREQIDRILREGSRQGRRGSHAAIERILKHEPGLERAELWKRIRRLKRTPRTLAIRRCVWSAEDDELLRKSYELGPAEKRAVIQELLRRHPQWSACTIWKRASKLGLVVHKARRGEEHRLQRWSEADDRKLLSLAGEKRIEVIAKLLHRSAPAIRCRLAWLGKKTRVHHDGYARRALAEELHMGRHTIQRLIAEGFLEVRDPRITRKSIAQLCRSGVLKSVQPDGTESIATETKSVEVALTDGESHSISPVPETAPITSAPLSRAKRLWADVAHNLNVDHKVVEKWVAQGILQLHDPRITEQSFRKFCRVHGALITEDFLNRETRAWLRTSMGWDRNAGKNIAETLAALRSHALVVRKCSRCGRDIRGNAFFRHRKECNREEVQELEGRARIQRMA